MNHNLFKYYSCDESEKKDWMKYVDNLAFSGRLYVIKPSYEPDYTQLSSKEIKKLVGLLLKEMPISDRYDTITEYDYDSKLPEFLADYMISNSELELNKMANFIANNTVNYYMEHVENIFEQVREVYEKLQQCGKDY